METDFRVFFLLVETIIEIRRNSILKKYIAARGSLFVVEETDFPASGNHVFSQFFRDSCQFFSVWQKSIFQ